MGVVGSVIDDPIPVNLDPSDPFSFAGYRGGIPVTRRNLSLTSPFQTTSSDVGACSSRKRPIDEENPIHSSGEGKVINSDHALPSVDYFVCVTMIVLYSLNPFR